MDQSPASPPRPGVPLYRSHSYAHPTNDSERTPLLRAQSHTPADPHHRQWTGALKRKSAAFSDFVSGHSHSSWTMPLTVDELSDTSGDDRPRAHEGDVQHPLSRKASNVGGYDGEFRADLEGAGGQGVRIWYESYSVIDWLHDSVKSSIRRRKLRARKRDGIRGWAVNVWDGAQGWLLVSIVGFLTACVAFLVIRSEMLLFDYKEGYCSKNIYLAKRFCCPAPTAPRHSSALFANPSAATVHGAVSENSFVRGWSIGISVEECKDWRTWGEVWNDSAASGEGGEGDDWLVDYVAFIGIAVALAVAASTLTVYLSASTSVYSSKDSPSIPHPGFSPDFPSPGPQSETSSLSGDAAETETTSKSPIPFVTAARKRKTMYFAAGSGIPEIKTILSGFVIRGYLGSWTLFTKAVGLALSVASGLSLGKEGPFVHLASCVGNICSRFFPKYDRNEGRRREVLSAACAAGVAVAFGSPVGGTLFSLEEVSYYFPPKVMFRSFFCAMIAAASLRQFNPFGNGTLVLFQVTYDRGWNSTELIGFIFLGILGGVYGAMFCKANIWWTRHVRNVYLKSNPILEVAGVALVTVIISFKNPFTKMGGTELVSLLFSECHREDSFEGLCVSSPELVYGLLKTLALALIVKAALTVITFGIKLPAGIFIPTLAVGACFGRMAGLLVEVAHANYPMLEIFDACRRSETGGPLPFGQSCVLPGVWAMVGAAAALAGVTRTTVSLVVIMFELTGTVSYTVPVMLGVLIAKTVADALEPRSIYDLVIELSDLPYLDAKTQYVHELSPQDILDGNAPTISLNEHNTVRSLRKKLGKLYRDGSGGGFPLVAEDQGGLRMWGYIAAKELEHGLAIAGLSSPDIPITFRSASALMSGVSLPASRISSSTPSSHDFSWLVNLAPIVVNHRSPMELCHELFSKLGVRYLVCVDERGWYLGVIEKNRYLAYLQWLERGVKDEGKWMRKASKRTAA